MAEETKSLDELKDEFTEASIAVEEAKKQVWKSEAALESAEIDLRQARSRERKAKKAFLDAGRGR